MLSTREKLIHMGLDPRYRGFTCMEYLIDNYSYSDTAVVPIQHIIKNVSSAVGISVNVMDRALNVLAKNALKNPQNELLKSIFPADSAEYPPTTKNFLCALLSLLHPV